MKTLLFCFLLLTPVLAGYDSSSSSESCDSDEHGHGGHRPPGRPRPPGNGNGNGGGNGGCDNGWRRFNRPSGGWCIRAFGGNLNQANAEAQCQSYGGTLSSLQNYEEIQYITSSALRVMPQSTGSVWVGARRTGTCTGRPLGGACTTLNSFYWTDNSASGTAGFVWTPGQPDNAHTPRVQNCAVLTASPTANIFDGKHYWPANNLDDVPCDLTRMASVSPRKVVAYVCGKRSTR